MSYFLTNLHTQLRNLIATGRGTDPSSIQGRGTHKEYPRMPRLALPQPQPLHARLDEVLHNRASFSAPSEESGYEAQELGNLLGHALGMRGEITRTYPSGGALYPVETYLLGHTLNDKPFGVFHYHPKAHALEYLWDLSVPMSSLVLTTASPLSPTLMVFTSVWHRASAKYGDWSYNHAMLEAGHMAQNVLLVAEALKLRTRPTLGFADAAIKEVLDLDAHEQPIYGIFLSRSAGAGDAVYE